MTPKAYGLVAMSTGVIIGACAVTYGHPLVFGLALTGGLFVRYSSSWVTRD